MSISRKMLGFLQCTIDEAILITNLTMTNMPYLVSLAVNRIFYTAWR